MRNQKRGDERTSGMIVPLTFHMKLTAYSSGAYKNGGPRTSWPEPPIGPLALGHDLGTTVLR